ncbi:MAG TPA: MFS transporter [Elusimicrobia bacterium]|nr:MAG: peptide ABC transporter [Elusimicrobia bacterium GWA2_66_18]OGR73668.1 MAG: peptide ABC transporter [Elusimicrobia bacterium GWC2_65_9]HAZ07709.1 MFS transporter [Elusimicrobiota bacterium]
MNAKATTATGEWFGHPKGLYVLFFTEMWERFSYYGMRSLLVLYMAKYLINKADNGLDVLGYGAIRHFVQWFVGLFGMRGELSVQAFSSQIYGLYTGFVYFTPFFGGILADKVFGQRKTVYIGAVLMAIGHFLMASERLFFAALLFLILGNGCFKPNISTQVGNLYPEGDHRRDSAFTIFYMGINLGAMFSPLVCGTLGQKVGWHWGFGAAGVGMIIGLCVYYFGKHLLPPDRIMKKAAAHEEAVDHAITPTEWKAIGALVFLCMVNIVFWAVYEQQGNTLQLWADQNTRWRFFGFNVPSSWYQVFNPAFIVIFAPLMDMFWGWQDKRGREPSSVTKMGIGCILLGGAFIIMIAASKAVGPTEQGSLLWLVTTTWLFTMGELYLSPIGLSLVTKVAPARMVSMLMGMWFLSSFFGNYLSGFIGGFYETMTKDAFFTLLMALGVGAGLIFFAANKPLRKIIGHGV